MDIFESSGHESSQWTNTILDNVAILTDSKARMSDSAVLHHSMNLQLSTRNKDVVKDTLFMKIDAWWEYKFTICIIHRRKEYFA